MSFVLDPNKNGGYPFLADLPDMTEIPFHTKPYPVSLMLKKPDEYPYSPILPRKIETSVTRIFAKNFTKKIYFGEKLLNQFT